MLSEAKVQRVFKEVLDTQELRGLPGLKALLDNLARMEHEEILVIQVLQELKAL